MKGVIFERHGDWSGYEISKSEKGFVVEYSSRVQGGKNGAKYLYKFDDTFTPDTELNTDWNEIMTYGKYLAETIKGEYARAKEFGNKTNIVCLAKGHEVQ